MKYIYRFCLLLIMMLLSFAGCKEIAHAANVSVTIPTSLDIVFNEDGSNTVSDFVIKNESELPITIDHISITEYNGWSLVPSGTSIPVNTKQFRLKQENQWLSSGTNIVHILVPENTQKNLKFEVGRGAWTTPGDSEQALSLELEYTIGRRQFELNLEGYEKMSVYNNETITLPTLEKDGYEFQGWEDVDGTIYVDTFTMPIGDVVLTPTWKPIVAYAIFSEDDQSLTFVKTAETITVGGVYNGKTVTSVYTGFEEDVYAKEAEVPWYADKVSYKVKRLVFQDEIKPKSTARWFFFMSYCEYVDVRKLDTSEVTDMEKTFSYVGFSASKCEWLGLENLDVSNVRNMSCTFAFTCRDVVNTNINLSAWDVSNVENMYQMFNGMGYFSTSFSIGDISGWNVAKVTNMKEMFQQTGYKATWRLDCSKWNVQSVTNHDYFNFLSDTKVIEPNWVN